MTLSEPVSLAELPAGHSLPPLSVAFTSERVAQYAGVVGPRGAGAAEDGGIVPPSGVAALGLGALLQIISLPPGTLHASQELTFLRPVSVGATLTCRAHVSSRSNRGGATFVALDFSLGPEQGSPAAQGKTTLILPEA